MVKSIDIKILKKNTEKPVANSLEGIRATLIKSIDKELEPKKETKRNNTIIKKGNKGELYAILKYGHLVVAGFEIDSNIEDELKVIREKLANKQIDSDIEKFMKTKAYVDYAARIESMRKKKEEKEDKA